MFSSVGFEEINWSVHRLRELIFFGFLAVGEETEIPCFLLEHQKLFRGFRKSCEENDISIGIHPDDVDQKAEKLNSSYFRQPFFLENLNNFFSIQQQTVSLFDILKCPSDLFSILTVDEYESWKEGIPNFIDKLHVKSVCWNAIEVRFFG